MAPNKNKKPGIDWLTAAAIVTKAAKAGQTAKAQRFINHARHAQGVGNIGGHNKC